jgi:hypothetical protein
MQTEPPTSDNGEGGEPMEKEWSVQQMVLAHKSESGWSAHLTKSVHNQSLRGDCTSSRRHWRTGGRPGVRDDWRVNTKSTIYKRKS